MRRLERNAGAGSGPGAGARSPEEYRRVWFDLPTGTEAARRARALTRETLLLWGTAEAADVDDVVLMVDELVTNAVVHGSGPVRLALSADGDLLLGEVSDAGTTLPASAPVGLDAEGGRGLWLVAMLSVDHGVRSDAVGKTVWFTKQIQARRGQRSTTGGSARSWSGSPQSRSGA